MSSEAVGLIAWWVILMAHKVNLGIFWNPIKLGRVPISILAKRLLGSSRAFLLFLQGHMEHISHGIFFVNHILHVHIHTYICIYNQFWLTLFLYIYMLHYATHHASERYFARGWANIATLVTSAGGTVPSRSATMSASPWRIRNLGTWETHWKTQIVHHFSGYSGTK
jgi:hypothetical protein